MSEVPVAEQSNPQPIDLAQLDYNQLLALKNQADHAILLFHDSLQNLKHAQNKFQESFESLDKFTPRAEGKEILVPLTSSMYVPGKLIDTEKILVDIGTGYFVEMKIQEARDYFTRRLAYVTSQMEKIQVLAFEKSKFRQAVIETMETKTVDLQKNQCNEHIKTAVK